MDVVARLTCIFVERLWRSVKHEDVYLHGYATIGELLIGLKKTSRSTTVSARTRHCKIARPVLYTKVPQAVEP